MAMNQQHVPEPELPLPARLAVALEDQARLDPVADALRRATTPLGDSSAGPMLRGEWLGHALHPSLTDLPIGLWTAASVLDLVGGQAARPAARRLLGLGLLAAGPTAVTGWVEWGRADRRGQRVGIVHAALNVTAVAFYAWSWTARRDDRHRFGAVLALAGAGAASAAGYLGGHLTTVLGVGSRHPDLDTQDRHEDHSVAGTIPTATSQEETSRAAEAAAKRVTGDDVVEVVAAQHAHLTMLAKKVKAGRLEVEGEALAELLRYLAGHEAVEEELIHPIMPFLDGRGVGAERIREEEGAAQQILRLEELDPGTSTFEVQFGLLEEAVTHHAKAEELEELPQVVMRLTDGQAAVIVDAFEAQAASTASRRGTFAQMLEGARADVRALVAEREARA